MRRRRLDDDVAVRDGVDPQIVAAGEAGVAARTRERHSRLGVGLSRTFGQVATVPKRVSLQALGA
jgi:hypothetical protein